MLKIIRGWIKLLLDAEERPGRNCEVRDFLFQSGGRRPDKRSVFSLLLRLCFCGVSQNLCLDVLVLAADMLFLSFWKLEAFRLLILKGPPGSGKAAGPWCGRKGCAALVVLGAGKRPGRFCVLFFPKSHLR